MEGLDWDLGILGGGEGNVIKNEETKFFWIVF